MPGSPVDTKEIANRVMAPVSQKLFVTRKVSSTWAAGGSCASKNVMTQRKLIENSSKTFDNFSTTELSRRSRNSGRRMRRHGYDKAHTRLAGPPINAEAGNQVCTSDGESVCLIM